MHYFQNTENSQTSVNDSAGSAANSVTDGNGENSHEEVGYYKLVLLVANLANTK